MKNKIIIIILIVGIIMISKNSFSKYISITNINVSSKIVQPIITIEEDKILNITEFKNQIYNFKVKNYSEEKINEIEMEYYIEFLSNQSQYIKYKIYKEGEEIKLTRNKTEKFLLNKNNKQEDNYTIEVLLKENSDQEILENIKMKIYYEQKEV